MWKISHTFYCLFNNCGAYFAEESQNSMEHCGDYGSGSTVNCNKAKKGGRMMKQMDKIIALIGEKVAVKAANAVSWPYCYQPKTPNVLKEKQGKRN